MPSGHFLTHEVGWIPNEDGVIKRKEICGLSMGAYYNQKTDDAINFAKFQMDSTRLSAI